MAQCALAKRSYTVEGYRRLVCPKGNKPKRWLVLSRILVPSTKVLARPQNNASSPNIAILLLSLLGPTDMM